MTEGIRGHSPNAKTTYTLEKKLVIVEQLHWRCGNPRATPVYPALGGDGSGSRSEVAFGSCTGLEFEEGAFLHHKTAATALVRFRLLSHCVNHLHLFTC
jgi:hypothetical protein